MTHLYIEQNTGLTEEVNSSIIAKLYELANNGDLDETSDLKGRLHSNAGYEYQINYLNEIFGPNLVISVDNKYLRLYDSALQQPFATKWGDGIGVTATQLSLANAKHSDISNIINALPDNVLTDLRDLKRLGTQQGTGVFGEGFGNNKVKNVVRAYIPNAYNTIRTGEVESAFGAVLQDIEVSSNVTNFDRYAFYGCSNLTMEELPDSITNLGTYAFSGCSNITINSSKNVTSMSSSAFYNCTSITAFTVKNICGMNGSSFFYGCSNLETVTFEQGSGPDIYFQNEGGWSGGVFKNTKITTLDLPERIVSFGNASMNCSTLRTLIIRKTTVPSKGSWSLNNNVQIYVPDKSVQLYKDTWTDVADRIYPISELPQS